MRAILSAIPILLWLLLGFLYQPCWKAHCGGQNGDSTSSVSSGEATENNETLSPTDDVGDADNGIVESSNDEGTLSKESAFEGVNIGSEKMAKKVEKIANKTVIRFPYNSVSKLDDKEVEEYLDQVAVRVIASGEKVLLTGHTDSYGDEASNRRLGRYRANVIKEYLVAKGVPVQQIQAFTKGESDPIASNRTAQGRAQNRRTELQIIQ
jgi:outer membrane protein OmpA-like peptidoglycan-associated protein